MTTSPPPSSRERPPRSAVLRQLFPLRELGAALRQLGLWTAMVVPVGLLAGSGRAVHACELLLESIVE